MSNNGQVLSINPLGRNYNASNNRSYANQPNCYEDPNELVHEWEDFLSSSRNFARTPRVRRTVMRTLVDMKVLSFIQDRLPLEAVIPLPQNRALLYISQNEHSQLSLASNALTAKESPFHVQLHELPSGLYFDTEVFPADQNRLFALLDQFGWLKKGVASYICENTNPILVVRNESEEVVAAMMAESLQMNDVLLAEITEMAVLPQYQERGIAKSLIQALSILCWERYGQHCLIYGEFNLTTSAHRAAAAAGMSPAIYKGIDGVLRDHVAITTGAPKVEIPPWPTKYLHSYQVMYWQRPLQEELLGLL